jgi:hypothetical protein
MATTNEKNNWATPGGYTADDHNGHTGVGDTPEQAQEALEAAQREGAARGVYESLGGITFTFGREGEDDWE